MKRLIKSPIVNAVCIGLFSLLYSICFGMSVGAVQHELQSDSLHSHHPFWAAWSGFLAAGHGMYITWALAAVTILVIALLLLRRRPYDDYHTAILIHCLVAALVLTMIAIGVLFVLALSPAWIMSKITLFIAVHWATVVLSNLAYVFLCRWR
jgi:heme A synthase